MRAFSRQARAAPTAQTARSTNSPLKPEPKVLRHLNPRILKSQNSTSLKVLVHPGPLVLVTGERGSEKGQGLSKVLTVH